MTLFNYILENSDAVIFYSIFTGVAGALGYSFVSSYFNNAFASKVDKGTQTDVWEDYSDRPSQIIQDSVTSIDTQTPQFSPVEYTSTGSQINSSTIEAGSQTINEGASTATTVLPIPNAEVLPVPNTEVLPVPNVPIQNWDQVAQLIANAPLREDELLQIELVEKITAWVQIANNLFN